jgi:serine protease Do
VATAALAAFTVLALPIGPAAAQKAPARDVTPQPDEVITLNAFQEVARRVNAGVVNVSTDLMERFFGPQPDPGPRRQNSLGSGFVIDEAGHILTNRHVVEGAEEIEVEFPDGGRFPATVVGRDARTDVALLKIEATPPLTVLPLGDSDRMDPGEWVIAVGNPFGFSNSVTVGVVSYRGRPLTLGTQGTSVAMLQTDASINPGNSGGPLLNLAGEVVGINTLMVTRGLPQSAGVGFAVPINVARSILPQLRETGRVVRGWLGAAVQPLDQELAQTFGLDEARGAVVSDVAPGSPAQRAGLQPGDIVLSVDGRPVEDARALSDAIAALQPGTKVQVRVRRQGADRTLPVTLGTFPDETAGAGATADGASGPLGMAVQPLTPDQAASLELPAGTQGLVVGEVEVGKPAEQAGLRQGDVIVSVNGTEVADVASFQSAIARARRQGGLARLRVHRGGAYQFLVLKVTQGP